MPDTTVYCVQTYWRDRRRLNMGDLRQFMKEDEARSAGERSALRQDGVIVYALTGEPEFDYWGEPRVLATYGETPVASV